MEYTAQDIEVIVAELRRQYVAQANKTKPAATNLSLNDLNISF